MSAVLRLEKIETIFDHGVTDEEFMSLYGFTETREDYEYALGQNDAYRDLYSLYLNRGDSVKAETFLAKIDPTTRQRALQGGCVQ